MHSIVTTFRGAVIKVEVANFCAAMDTLIDQDESHADHMSYHFFRHHMKKMINTSLTLIMSML